MSGLFSWEPVLAAVAVLAGSRIDPQQKTALHDSVYVIRRAISSGAKIPILVLLLMGGTTFFIGTVAMFLFVAGLATGDSINKDECFGT